jgi:microcystin-dependent protein
MSYQVTFTETNNPLKPPITVEDQTVNTQTNMTFVGKNYSGYGPLLAKNFLHLLENFSSPTQPAKPVQGQLWFDNNPSVSQLKVNIDGTANGWVSAGGVKKSASTPTGASSIQGDLWVDTVNQQLSLYTGSNWLLVGPSFSQGSQTGPKLETIVDTANISHTVQSIYVENNRLIVISNAAFTPKATQDGFAQFKKGINLYKASSGDAYKLIGVASQADTLTDPQTGLGVPSTNFLRSDQPSTTNYGFNVRSASGLTVGSDTGAITLFTESATNAATFYAKSGNSINFKLNVNGTASTVLHLDPNAFVGINKSNPTVALDVNGYIAASQIALTSKDADSVTVAGGIVVSGDTSLQTLNINGLLSLGGDIQPLLSNVYNLGSDPTISGGSQFASIYATNFYGNFNGTFSGGFQGSVSGSATKLSSPTVFSIAGDVVNTVTDNASFDGQNQTVTFNTKLTSIAVSSQASITSTTGVEEILLYSPTASSLKKISVNNLTNSFPVVPVGCIFPYAGPATNIPKGYFLCDGAEINSSAYSGLFSVIGYTYKAVGSLQGAGTFGLPDLRGRFALGRDNMNNNVQVNTPAGVGIYTVSATAGRVTNAFAKNLGGTSGQESVILETKNIPEHTHTLKGNAGNQYFAVRNVAGTPDDTNAISGVGGQAAAQAQYLATSGGVLSDTHGELVNTMNPYLAINYIIFHGVLI